METGEKRNRLVWILSFFLPPPQWRVAVILLLGVITGIGMHILYTSRAISYLSDQPETCINCHIMRPQYITWERSSHGRVTTCNDCHVPQDNILRAYLFKAQDGLRHAWVFTFRGEPQVIRIKEAGKQVVQENCRRCHQNQVHPILTSPLTGQENGMEKRLCWECHRETPHGRVHSMTSTPNTPVPGLPPLLPTWLNRSLKSSDR